MTNPCGDAPDCIEIPEGIRALRDLLREAELQLVNTEGSCRPARACYVEPDVGECTGRFERYAYDADTGRCVTFSYGGCGGNDNRFETLEECESACGFDPCVLGTLLGPEDGACEPGRDVPTVERCFGSQEAQCACDCAVNRTSVCGTCE